VTTARVSFVAGTVTGLHDAAQVTLTGIRKQVKPDKWHPSRARGSLNLPPLLAQFVEPALLELLLIHNHMKLHACIEGQEPRFGQGGNP
jgi:hypothetical protein